MGDPLDGHGFVMPPHEVDGHKFTLQTPLVVHLDDVTAPGARLSRIASLGVARIDDSRALFVHHPVRVDMPQGPIVHAGVLEVLDLAGCVIEVVLVVADIGVEQPDGPGGVGFLFKPGCEVVRHTFSPIAHAVDSGDLNARFEERFGFHCLGAEDPYVVGPGEPGLPP